VIIRVLKTGKDAAGLTRYLFGPGKVEEHTNQRMIAGSPELMGEWSGQPLNMREATHLGRVVEASWRRQYAPELAMAGVGAGGISRENLVTSNDDVAGQDHVFHAALSLPASAGTLTDEQWQEVATKYVEAMGFTGVDGKPDCSWFAVNHGLSEKGNDHIHVVVCATRGDGSRVSLHNTGRRSQGRPREILESLPYIAKLHDTARAEHAPRAKDFTAEEHNIARERHARGLRDTATPDRVLLQRLVRAAASSSRTEAEFINTVISNRNRVERTADGRPRLVGLEIAAARWQPGSNKTVVTGYKVRFVERALDRKTGQPVLDGAGAETKTGVWFSASSLAPDLTLSKLRQRWADAETTGTRAYADALWAESAMLAKRPSVDAGAELDQAVAALAEANDAIATLDPNDVEAWRHVEAATAGATAVISTGAQRSRDADGRETGFSVEAGRASDVLTRQWLADTYSGTQAQAPRVPPGLSRMEVATRHVQLAIRAGGTDRHTGWLTVIRQLSRTIDAIANAKQARGELIAATALRHDALTAMNRLETWLGTRTQDVERSQRAPASTSAQLSAEARTALEASGHAAPRRGTSPLDSARFPAGVEYRDGVPTYPTISKPQALAHLESLAPSPEATSETLARWKGIDPDVDRALAAKRPALFTERERQALAATEPTANRAQRTSGAERGHGTGPTRR